MKNRFSTLPNTKRKLVLGGAVAALSLLLPPITQALTYSDNWDDGNALDGLPLTWLQTGSSGSPKTWTFPVNPAGGLAYKLSGGNAGTIMSLLGYQADQGWRAAVHFRQSVDVIDWNNNPVSGSTMFGLIGRLSASNTGYGLFIRNPTGGTATSFRINRFDPGNIQTTIAEGIFATPITPSGDYTLHFSADGGFLQGQIFDKATGSAVPLSGGTGVSYDGKSIKVLDSTYQLAGMYGVGALCENATAVTATFDNYRIDIVPEPSALALAGLGMASLLAFRRRSS